MKSKIYILQALITSIYLFYTGEIHADSYIMNTDLAKASLNLERPISSSNCIVEIKITGITDRPLLINKLPQAPTLKMILVGSDGRKCPLTKKGEDYYSEKSWTRHMSSGILVWLKKDEPISIKMDLAEFFQLKAGNWTLEVSIPLSQIREEGAPGQEGGWVEFKGIKIEIPESKK
jgi:hypothetical protein